MGGKKSGQAATRLTASTYGSLHGQAASEYIILLAIALIVMSMIVVFVYIWPDYTYSVKKQRSENYWQDSKPFAIKSNAMYPDKLILEIQNTEPVSLTVTKLFVDGNPMNFYNYTIPFTWGANDLCPRGVCALTMRPGETQIISTGNYTSNPLNPCMAGTSFTAGLDYETDFAITYYASDPGALENETGNFPLIGKCTAAPA